MSTRKAPWKGKTQQSSTGYFKYKSLLESTLGRSAADVYDAISKICGMQLEQLLYRTEQLFTCCCWLFSMNPSSVGPRRMYGVAQGSSSAVKDNNISETSCLRSLGCCEASSLFQLKSTACNEAPAIPIFIYSSICSKQNI